MAFVLLFVYLNHMAQMGYSISITSQIVLVVLGLAQIISWWVTNFLKLTLSVEDNKDESKKVKRLDDCFRD